MKTRKKNLATFTARGNFAQKKTVFLLLTLYLLLSKKRTPNLL